MLCPAGQYSHSLGIMRAYCADSNALRRGTEYTDRHRLAAVPSSYEIYALATFLYLFVTLICKIKVNVYN